MRIQGVIAGLLLFALQACAPEPHALTLAHSTQQPATPIAESVGEILALEGLSISIESVPDHTELIDRVLQGDIDLAIVEEPDRSVPGLVTLAPLYPGVLHVLHNRGADVTELGELLRGASVYTGGIGGTAHRLLIELIKDFGIADSEFTVLDNPWTQTPDVYFIVGGLLANEQVTQLADYRLFSFGMPGDVSGGTLADGIVLRHHYLSPFLLPRRIYPGLAEEAVLTLSIRSILIARSDFDDDLAYTISSTLFQHAQEISEHYPLVTRELTDGMPVANLMLPPHESTRRYLDRDGPTFIERYVEVLALYFTIFVTAVSGLIALYRYRQRVRKDRVDAYVQNLLDIRDAARTEGQSADLATYREQVLGVQHEVMDLLINERIEADASLVAFMSLSNQLLQELD